MAIHALRNFLLRNNVYVFSEATTTVLESLTNPTEKRLCWSLFFKNLQTCRPISSLFFSISDNSCKLRQILLFA